ncbi:hypothetical protein [Dysgonomonas termitidis]|uniref:DUF4304 domain-containing protein n=1 Tax=Dysgonomonas termitidis TaxID=1516126 RepID=A0ABV9KST2_9BACT
MKKAEIRNPFLKMIEYHLLPVGFEKKKTNEGSEYLLKTKSGFNCVTPIINQYGSVFYISMAFAIRIDEVSVILSFINNIHDEFEEFPTINCGFSHLITYDDNRIRVENEEEFNEALKMLSHILENEALDFFEKYKTTADIDKDMNRFNRPKDAFYNDNRELIGLISAVLNKNPQAKYWENYYRESIQKMNQYTKDQYEKLVSYLKENYPGVL